MKFLCTKCWNSGWVKERVRISRSELTPRELAEILVEGGYFYRLIKRPCSCGRGQPIALDLPYDWKEPE